MRRKHPKRFNSIFYQRATRQENDNHIAGKIRLRTLASKYVDRVHFEIKYERPEAPEWPYYADILCIKGHYTFILEVDGDSHLRPNRRWKDRIRDIWFWEYHGIKTIRFSTDELSSKQKLTDQEIWKEIDKRLGCDFNQKGLATLFCWYSEKERTATTN
jgi:very-short-patch-repair endonuclease